MDALTTITRLIGLGTAGVLLFDANGSGRANSKKQYSAQIANALPDIYSKSVKMDGYSDVGNGLKKNTFRWALDDGITPAISSAFGYVSGAVGHLIDNILPAGLATVALLSKNSKGNIGTAGKLAGVGLVLTAGKYLLFDVFGVGKPRVFDHKT